MEYVTYVLRSLNSGRIYVGMTADLNRRIGEHNRGKCHTTQRDLPWELIKAERFPTSLLARRREKYLKSGDGRKTILCWKSVFV